MSRTAAIIVESQDYYRENKKRIWLLGIIILIFAVIFSVGFITKTVTASRNRERVKLVTSIEIQKGDTLWAIASEHMSDEYDNVKDYIDEIKLSNGLVSDEIHTGNFLILPYYEDSEYKEDSAYKEGVIYQDNFASK
ncbi:MAG TPA: LysM peptidoglycan-binding domain-containing protein [Clostridiales bacterium]|nr:LysM peptidoglycan-binding domain-containing protein [Clostridiales bacterium]